MIAIFHIFSRISILETYGDEDAEIQTRNRIVCYADGAQFDYADIIERQITENGYDISFVSTRNECILSIYDDRGCDVFFAAEEKFKEFYHKLKPYFLNYDLDTMEKRYKDLTDY